MRVLVTGVSGLLGTWLARLAPADVELAGTFHRTPVPPRVTTTSVDLRDAQQTLDAIVDSAPHVIVHGAYAKDRCSIIDATANVTRAAVNRKIMLVYISTEAVFCGDGRVREENDAPDPVWEYGRWKAEAETHVASTMPSAAIVRLPLLVSDDPPDDTTQRVTSHDPTGCWYVDEFRQPAFADDVARAVWTLTRVDPQAAAGTWHLPGPQVMSRLELARRVARRAGLSDKRLRAGRRPRGRDAPPDLRLCGHRAQAALAWQPHPIE